MIRWISYTSQNIPGSQSFELGFHSSLEAARLVYDEICYQLDTNDVSMWLYWVGHNDGQNMIELAHEFADIGNPFDYPSKVVERGPRGGVRFVNA